MGRNDEKKSSAVSACSTEISRKPAKRGKKRIRNTCGGKRKESSGKMRNHREQPIFLGDRREQEGKSAEGLIRRAVTKKTLPGKKRSKGGCGGDLAGLEGKTSHNATHIFIKTQCEGDQALENLVRRKDAGGVRDKARHGLKNTRIGGKWEEEQHTEKG